MFSRLQVLFGGKVPHPRARGLTTLTAQVSELLSRALAGCKRKIAHRRQGSHQPHRPGQFQSRRVSHAGRRASPQEDTRGEYKNMKTSSMMGILAVISCDDADPWRAKGDGNRSPAVDGRDGLLHRKNDNIPSK